MHRILGLIIGLLLLAGSAAAQESTSPLMRMLERIPATEGAMRYWIYFDRAAIAQGYPGSTMPPNAAIFQNTLGIQNASDVGATFALWWQIYRSGMDPIAMSLQAALDEMPAAMGMDYFAIQQVMQVGNPPGTITVLAGDFNADAVEAAFIGQGFVRQDRSDATLLCSADGCDAGMTTNFQNRNVANVFGGDLGRQQPLWIGDGFLFSSADYEPVEKAIAGTMSTLGELTLTTAVISSLEARGTVIQAAAYHPRDIGMADADASTEGLEPLPRYTMAVFADVMTEGEQQGIVALGFSDRLSARTAIPEIVRRIEMLNSNAIAEKTYLDLVTERKASISAELVFPQGWPVVLITLSSPRLTADEIFGLAQRSLSAEEVSGAAPGALYSLLQRMVMMRDLEWLRITP